MDWITTISGEGFMKMGAAGPAKELDWTKVKEELDKVVMEVTQEWQEWMTWWALPMKVWLKVGKKLPRRFKPT
jgi:hypothetical protein